MISRKHLAAVCACTSLVLTGCTSTPIAIAPVGPDAIGRADRGPEGHLEVYTATQTVDVDYQAFFNPHTGYDIKDTSGKDVKFVPNHTTNMDELPDQVSLLPGSYQIVAQSTWCGLVTVPVVIQKGKTTVVHLDDSSWRPPRTVASDQLVYLPNGQAVGWSGSIAGLSR